EVAAALTLNGVPVTMVFPDSGIGARIFPRDLSDFVTGYYRGKGVDVRAGVSVAGIERAQASLRIRTSDGGSLEAEVVVAGLGIVPDIALAEAAGLATTDGVNVDAH